MAHYDCSNCGASMGIHFGECRSCTPPEYHEIIRSIAKVKTAASNAWEQNIAEEMKALEARRNAFVEGFCEEHGIGEMQKKLHDLRMKHDNGYRYDYARRQRNRMIHPTTGDEIYVEPGDQIPLFPNL